MHKLWGKRCLSWREWKFQDITQCDSRLPLTSSINWICSTYLLRTAYLGWFANTQQTLVINSSYFVQSWISLIAFFFFIWWYNLRFTHMWCQTWYTIPCWIGFSRATLSSRNSITKVIVLKILWISRLAVSRNVKTISIKFSGLQESSWILSYDTLS